MFLDAIILLVRIENWPQANLHVTKESKIIKTKIRGGYRVCVCVGGGGS